MPRPIGRLRQATNRRNCRVVAFRHVGKARTETIVIGSDERVLSLKIDVVANGNQRTLAVSRIDTASSIRQDSGFHAHASKDPHRERDLLCRISLIEMDAALHSSHGNSFDQADDQVPCVSYGRALREGRDFRVGDSNRVRKVIGKATETGTQHQCDFRAKGGARQDILRRPFSYRELIKTVWGQFHVGGQSALEFEFPPG